MFFPRVGGSRSRRARPLLQAVTALRRFLHHCVTQPAIERFGHWCRARIAERSQVVERHPAADDEDALVAQWCECAADGEVLSGIQSPLQRQLHRGHVRFRICELQRNERAVVVTTLAISLVCDTRSIEQSSHARRQSWSAGRGPLYLVRL